MYLTIHIEDCPGTDQDRERAADRFEQSLIETLGSVEKIKAAYLRAEEILEKHGGWGGNVQATPEEERDYNTWQSAVESAEQFAFADWEIRPGSAVFKLLFS